jgi:peptide/nickel transport system substrate-binding protein/oligopeptide transport system substrate-binding protein
MKRISTYVLHNVYKKIRGGTFMKKRVLSLMLASVMALSLAACSSSSDSTSTTASEKELKVQVGPDLETVDPALNSAIDGAVVIMHAFEGLLVVGEDGSLEPGQAEDYEVSEDGLTWTFYLREGLKWSDGTDLNAHDFEYSWKRMCDPEVAAPYAETVLSMVEGFEEAAAGDLDALAVTAVDDLTFEVQLSNVCSYFGSLAAFISLSPVQEATVEENEDAWAIDASTYVSNGAFYMTDWQPGSHLTLSKNPYYWNADAVKLDKITFALVEDSNAAYSAYQSGELLMIKDVPTEEIPSLVDTDDFYVEPIIGTYYISFNLEKEMFQDAKVRQALNLAIDRTYVAETLMQGTYAAATNFVGPGWIDADGVTEFTENTEAFYDNDAYEANVEEAKALLAEAGYPNGEGFPQITYTTNDSGYHKVVAEYLQQAWAELGIDMKIEVVEWSSFTPMRRSGDFEIARNGWVGDYTDPSNMLDLLCTGNGNNDGRYSNEAYDAAMEVSRTTTDAAERSAALHEAEDILLEDAACIPLAYYNDFWLQSDKIVGSWHSAYGYWNFIYADIVE